MFFCSIEHQRQHHKIHAKQCFTLPESVKAKCNQYQVCLLQDPAKGIGLVNRSRAIEVGDIVFRLGADFSSGPYVPSAQNRKTAVREVVILFLGSADAASWLNYWSKRPGVLVSSTEVDIPNQFQERRDEWRVGCQIVETFCQEEESDDAGQFVLTVNPATHLLNHSCNPNCTIVDVQGVSIVAAQTAIQPRGEVTISYDPHRTAFLPYVKRQQYLLETFGFRCVCGRCVLEANTTVEGSVEFDILYHSVESIEDVALQQWIVDVEKFIQSNHLPDEHWQAHNLRILSGIVQTMLPVANQSEKTINAYHALETIRKTVAVNGKILPACSYVKEQSYQLFRKVSAMLAYSGARIESELSGADPCYRYYQTVWYDKTYDNPEFNQQTQQPQREETKTRLRSKLKSKKG